MSIGCSTLHTTCLIVFLSFASQYPPSLWFHTSSNRASVFGLTWIGVGDTLVVVWKQDSRFDIPCWIGRSNFSARFSLTSHSYSSSCCKPHQNHDALLDKLTSIAMPASVTSWHLLQGQLGPNSSRFWLKAFNSVFFCQERQGVTCDSIQPLKKIRPVVQLIWRDRANHLIESGTSGFAHSFVCKLYSCTTRAVQVVKLIAYIVVSRAFESLSVQ